MEEVRYWEPHIELMSKEQLRKIQLKRLKRTLKYVYEKSPYYHARFSEAGVRPEDLHTLLDIKKFPFTTKQDLRNHGVPHGILAVPRDQLISFQMSSGTTGTATIYPYTRSDIELWTNIIGRQLTCAGVKPGDILANSYGYYLFTGGLGTHYGALRLGAAVISWGPTRAEALVEAIRDRKATVISGTPSFLYHVSEVMEKAGINAEKELNLRIALPGAEAMSEEMRKRINERFGLRAHGGGARDYYGTAEQIGPGGGGECIYEKGIHMWADHFYFEIIDPSTGEPLGPGEEGELVFTHLTREGQPLIRFKQGDITTLNDEPCECGRVFPRCKIKGRTDDTVTFKGAKFLPRQVESVLLRFPELTGEYQIIWDKTVMPPEVYLRVESSVPIEALEKRLSEALLQDLFVRPKLEFVEPGTLPRSTGKAQRLIVKQR